MATAPPPTPSKRAWRCPVNVEGQEGHPGETKPEVSPIFPDTLTSGAPQHAKGGASMLTEVELPHDLGGGAICRGMEVAER
jgi:hypothetical protein